MESTTRLGWIKLIGMLLLAGIIIVSILRDRIVNQPYREVSITGRGTVEYVPDIAKVTLGVHVEKPTAQAALTEMNAVIDRVIPAIEALGVSRDSISTANLSLYPQYYYPSEMPSQISGYTADQQLTIELAIASSTDIVGKAIQAASIQGVNQVNSVTFDASNIEDLKQQATLEALTDARGRAQTLADAAGIKLGRTLGWWANPISVPGNPMPYYDSYGYGGDMGGGTTVPAGTSEVIIEVNLNYSTK